MSYSEIVIVPSSFISIYLYASNMQPNSSIFPYMANSVTELENTIPVWSWKSIVKYLYPLSLIHELQKSILNYLLKLSKASLNEDSRETVDALFNTVNDIERIGDHAENIAELAKDIVDLEISFSDVGIGELKDMYNKVVSTYTYALEAMRTSNVELACKVIKMEEQVDMMEKSCRANHMNRLNSSSCSIESGVIYLDIISNLERVSDHAVNIAQQVIAGRIVNK